MIFSLFRKFIIGLPTSATSPAASMYIITSRKNQQMAMTAAATVVYIMYLDSLSTLRSLSIASCFSQYSINGRQAKYRGSHACTGVAFKCLLARSGAAL